MSAGAPVLSKALLNFSRPTASMSSCSARPRNDVFEDTDVTDGSLSPPEHAQVVMLDGGARVGV